MTKIMSKNKIYSLLEESQLLASANDFPHAWKTLEDAHIISQPYAALHTLVHWRMLALSWKTNDLTELWGQLMRLVVAAPGSLFRKYPVGNTGRSDVSMFKPMPIPERLQKILSENKNV